jgi:hypothetical protein
MFVSFIGRKLHPVEGIGRSRISQKIAQVKHKFQLAGFQIRSHGGHKAVPSAAFYQSPTHHWLGKIPWFALRWLFVRPPDRCPSWKGWHNLASMDSGLEAFSLNPAHGSFSALTFQSTEFANYVNQRFLSY